jgi:hypothetical protein
MYIIVTPNFISLTTTLISCQEIQLNYFVWLPFYIPPIWTKKDLKKSHIAHKLPALYILFTQTPFSHQFTRDTALGDYLDHPNEFQNITRFTQEFLQEHMHCKRENLKIKSMPTDQQMNCSASTVSYSPQPVSINVC